MLHLHILRCIPIHSKRPRTETATQTTEQEPEIDAPQHDCSQGIREPLLHEVCKLNVGGEEFVCNVENTM